MRFKSLVAAALCASAVAAMGAGSASAGEITGNGKPTAIRANANSICAFSGQNDGNPPLGRTAEHVQSWGQTPKEGEPPAQPGRDFLTSIGSNPGKACNGHLSPRK
jgi:hypothetical protein